MVEELTMTLAEPEDPTGFSYTPPPYRNNGRNQGAASG